MGRHATGVMFTSEVQRLEINQLFKMGNFKNGCEINGFIHWTSGGKIQYESIINDDRQEVRLIYQINRYDEKKEMDYLIYLTSIPSNLGKGKIWYFVCPFTGKKSRILYLAYGCDYFKSRNSYQCRIYYPCQNASKAGYSAERCWEIEYQLGKLYPLCKKTKYKGKETRLSKRIFKLEIKREYYDQEMWSRMARKYSYFN